MRPLPLLTLPSTPPFVLGVSRIRGAAVPVVDVGALLGAAEPAAASRFVTVRAGDRRVALAVEAVLGIRDLPPSSRDDLPPLLGTDQEGVAAAVGALDAELLVVLRTARTMPEPVWRALEERGPE
jgi:purine-binding chemotaxis protein CheW